MTAQKQSERLQDVPVPVTAIEATALTTGNQLRLQDYYNTIPGVGVALSGNGGEPVVTIRGVTTGAEGNPTVGIVVDEVSYGSSVVTGGGTSPAVADIDPGDLAHVEVLRGPQGTLYGASSMGGLIKFVTVDPSMDAVSGRVQVGSSSVKHSDDFGYSVRASINLPVSDTFALRASGFTLRDPGYIDNAETGQRDANRRDSEGIHLASLWRPSDHFTLKLGAFIQDSERLGTEDVDTLLGEDPKQSFLTGTGTYRRKSQAYSATITSEFGAVELISATGYNVDKLEDTFDLSSIPFLSQAAIDNFSVDRIITSTDNKVEKFTQEVRISVPIGERIDWLIGAFYAHEDTLRVVDNLAADSNGATRGSLFKNLYDTGTFEEYAVFTNATVDVADRWDVQVGGRYGENKQVYPLVLSGPLAAQVFGSDPFISPKLESDDGAFTYLLTPRFKMSPDMMMYLRLASGYRPGGPVSLCGLPGVPCSFDPDKTKNYDLGIKGSTFHGILSFDASLYYIDWKDIQISGVRSATGFTYTGNVSRAKSQGIELSVDARADTGLTVSAWASYNEAELTEAFPSGNLFGLPGDRLPFGSRFSGSVSLNQDFPLGSATAFVGGSLNYVGDRRGSFQPQGVERETFPSYARLDLRTGVTYGTWAVQAFVNNVTDKRGVLRSGLDAALVPTYFTYIQPRSIGISVSRSF